MRAERTVLTGHIVDATTSAPISGLRVEWLDASGIFPDLLACTETSEDGAFELEVVTSDLIALAGRRKVTAALRVIDVSDPKAARVLIDKRRAGTKTPLDGRVAHTAFRLDKAQSLGELTDLLPYVVSGTLADDQGPLSHVRIALFDADPLRGLTSEPMEGATGSTDARGRYRVTYLPPRGKIAVDLVVRADTDPPTFSAHRCHAPPSVVVDLVQLGRVWRGPSTFALTRATLLPLTTRHEVPIAALTRDQISHLACSTRLPVASVHALALAEAIAHSSSPMEPEIVFAAALQGKADDRRTFFLHPKGAIRQMLKDAVSANHIPQRYAREGEMEDALSRWSMAAADYCLEQRSNPCGLGEILEVAGVPSSLQKSFAVALCANEAPLSTFMSNVAAQFDTDRIQLTLHWWSLARGHLPLIAALEVRRAEGTDLSLRDLAKLSEQDWLALLDTLPLAAPASIPGETEAARKHKYAELLYATMVAAFPSEAVRARVLAHPGERPALKGFFTAHPYFELGRDRLSQEPFRAALEQLDPADRRRLSAMERIFRLAPTYERTSVLLDCGYDSAHSIHAAGKDKVMSDIAELVGADQALDIYTKACWQASAASALFSAWSPKTNQLATSVLPDFFTPESSGGNSALADWQTLFGGAGGCACRHCEGILGPAAYLTDSLAWLERFPSKLPKQGGTKWSALDVLIGGQGPGAPQGKRPDLPLLELTCKSAHTPLPYIDLVNEILEVTVAKEAGATVDLGDRIRTTHKPEDLAAQPEILYETLHIRAWRSLMEKRFPFTLPVCLFDRESDSLLRSLGVSRAEIVETLGGAGDRLTKARLGIRDDDAPFVSGWKLLIGTDPAPAQAHWGGKPVWLLRKVPAFLQYSGLSFSELRELLATRYTSRYQPNAEGPLSLEPAESCDATAMTLPALHDAHLLHLHRFLRLRLLTSLSITDLDILLCAFSAASGPAAALAIDANVLRKVAGALTLAKELHLTVPEVAALFNDMDTHETWAPSAYRRLFIHRLKDSTPSLLFEAPLDDPETSASLSLHRTALCQALGIIERDLLLLTDASALETELSLPAFGPFGQLAVHSFDQPGTILAGVSALYRNVRFARALSLSISEYLVLRAYSNMVPIGPGADPDETLAFARLARRLQEAKIPATTVQWILRGVAHQGASFVPSAAELSALRADLQNGVTAILAETEATEDPAELSPTGSTEDGPSRASALLSSLLGDEAAASVMAVLRGAASPPSDGSFRDAIALLAPYLPGPLDDAKDLLAGPFTAPATQALPLLQSAGERFAYVAKWLDRHVRASRMVVEKLAAATKLPVLMVTYLTTQILRSGASPQEYTLLDDFLPAGKPNASNDAQITGLYTLFRHACLLRSLRVAEPVSDDPGELSWVYTAPPIMASPPPAPLLASLPTEVHATSFGEQDRIRFAQLAGLLERAGLRDRMKAGPGALFALLSATPASLEEAQSALAEQTDWDLVAIGAFCELFGIASGPDLLLDSSLLRMERAIALVQKLKISAKEVIAFIDLERPPPEAVPGGLQPQGAAAPSNANDLAHFARRAASAGRASGEKAEHKKGISDPFRELVRDRLVDALVPSVHPSRDDLYGFHLIDVDMSPWLTTSRIVQATNALQIFVQRAFLGLEKEVALPEQAGKQWEWRKAYRVWEANRKVFLWPENWLESDLRDDMTPLFRDLLSRLSSGELTDASAERALAGYLSGLHEIARLEPMGLTFDPQTNTDHILARTRSQPRKWYYRRRDGNGCFTPWEKADIEIEAESVALVVANRRLYAFWPHVVQKNDPVAAPTSLGKPIPPPPLPELGETSQEYDERLNKYVSEIQALAAPETEQKGHLEIRLAWSSLLDGAWTPKRLSDCTPISISPAKTETSAGYEARHLVLVLEPPTKTTTLGAIRLLCVATPWRAGGSTPYLKAGRFYFDACDGGRWTSLSLADTGQAYHPTILRDTRLSPTGFEQTGAGGAVYVRRGENHVMLLAEHEGAFSLVSPSQPVASPTHAFDRFLLSDYRTVFYGRALRTTSKATEGASTSFGVLVGSQSVHDALSASVKTPDPLAIWGQGIQLLAPVVSEDLFTLEVFEHPFVCELENRLAARGPAGLYDEGDTFALGAQYLSRELAALYGPSSQVTKPFPKQEVSFDLQHPFGTYNWELFFHVPLVIAERLSQEGRFAEAQKWLHFIFHPTSGAGASGPGRFWRFRPFREVDHIASIQTDLNALAATSSFAAPLKALFFSGSGADLQKESEELNAQLAAMAEHPFAPHVLARMRKLPYMAHVFMRYLQNLIDWADSLFRRDTMESIHEALSLYLLAKDLLGPKPEVLDHKAELPGKTFHELRDAGIDAFGNAAVLVESIVPKRVPLGFQCKDEGPPIPDFRLYFCVPPNEKLLAYWDIIADRLFKLRHGMNMEGIVRALPLFAPPIDPALLTRAAALGVSYDEVLDALGAPAPLYRFARLHAKAVELCISVQSLGQAMLAALEKKDAEELALLRQRQEADLLQAEREVRKQGILEARETLAGLERARQSAELRAQHYASLLDRGLLSQEKAAEKLARLAKENRVAAAAAEQMGAVFGAVPDTSAGIAAAVTIGGRALQLAASQVARGLSVQADSFSTDGGLAQTSAGYARRAEEWALQKTLSEKELLQLDRQIAAQQIRIAIAEHDQSTLELRRRLSREVLDFLHDKATHQELYSWMVRELSAEHYRAYQTAFDMAKRAERAYQHERGDDTTFIRFGAWDSLKKGLLAGERLLADLRALDAAYLTRSDREREITKHISLAELSGEQLTALRDTGSAIIDLPTSLFDADYPGHYFRRLKTVAISVAVVRPATDSVQCELTLLRSSYRKTSQTAGVPYPGHPFGEPEADPTHRYSTAAIKALVTSSADHDMGLFDGGLQDDKLLPFEGQGAVSRFQLDMDPKTNRFSLSRVYDVVLHLRYTAKDGGPALRAAALAYAESSSGLSRRTRVFAARRDFDEAWSVFEGGTKVADAPETWASRLELPFKESDFRSFFGSPKVKIARVQVSATFSASVEPPASPTSTLLYTLTPPGKPPLTGALDFRSGEPSSSHEEIMENGTAAPLSVPVLPGADSDFAPWVFQISAGTALPAALRLGADEHHLLRPDALEELWIIVTYEARS